MGTPQPTLGAASDDITPTLFVSGWAVWGNWGCEGPDALLKVTPRVYLPLAARSNGFSSWLSLVLSG